VVQSTLKIPQPAVQDSQWKFQAKLLI